MHWRWRPIMCLATDLVSGTSDLLRLLGRTTHLKLSCWDLMWMQWLSILCSHFYNYALEMAPDHASGKGLVGGYFRFTPTPGRDQAPEKKVS